MPRKKLINNEVAILLHIKKVNEYLSNFAIELLRRGQIHDNSAMSPPEKAAFDKYKPILYTKKYGSPEYYEIANKMKKAIIHHERNNSHHPGYYHNGINDMNLFDIIEMFCDWQAASQRIPGGNIFDSINTNQKRFEISTQLHNIFLNTARSLK